MHCGLRGGKKKKKDHLSCIYSPLFEKKKKKGITECPRRSARTQKRPPAACCVYGVALLDRITVYQSCYEFLSFLYPTYYIEIYTHIDVKDINIHFKQQQLTQIKNRK